MRRVEPIVFAAHATFCKQEHRIRRYTLFAEGHKINANCYISKERRRLGTEVTGRGVMGGSGVVLYRENNVVDTPLAL